MANDKTYFYYQGEIRKIFFQTNAVNYKFNADIIFFNK